MATIPMGNFGQAVARPVQQVAVPTADPIGQAMERTSAIAAGVNNEAMRRDAENAERTRRAQAALTLAKASNALQDVHDEVSAGVIDGTIDPAKARAEFQTRGQKATAPLLEGWAPEQRMTMDAHLAQIGGTLDRSIGQAVVKRGREDAAATIDAFGEQVQREAVRLGPAAAASKFGAFLDFTAPAAGLNADNVQKLRQAFTEKVHAQFFQTAGTAALTKGDPDALGELVKQVQGPDGDALDPQRRAVITHQLFGWQQSILAKRERDANRAADELRVRTNEAVDAFNKGMDLAMGGGYFSPEFITELTTKAAGTEMQGAVANLIGSQRLVAGFASKPADARAAELERMRSERATPGQGTDPAADKFFNSMVAMDQKLRQQAADNPWAAAQQAGVIRDAQVISAADPTQALGVLQQRMRTIGQVEAWAGNKVSPLQPAEVEQVGKLVRSLPLDQAASLLAGIGQAVGDADRVAALGKQLHDKDGSLGLAMVYANAKTTEGRYTAELILRGDQALRDNAAMIDKANGTGWKAMISKQIRGAYQNREVEDATVDAAFKIAAAQYVKDGSTNIDAAVRLATGGIVERNGAKVPLPYGMSERDFGKRIEAITPADLAPQAVDGQVRAGATAIPLADFVAQLPKATLQHAGQGLYSVRTGTGLVTGAGGRPIILKVAP